MKLGESYKFETSERSDSLNWIKKSIIRNGFKITGFEGYTIKNNSVTLLLDRALFYGKEKEWNSDELFSELKKMFTEKIFNIKVEFSKKIGIPWNFVAYQYKPEKIYVLNIEKNEMKLEKSFNNFLEFGRWTMNFRDLKMISRYEEEGLPDIDKILRQNNIPWPGNLDGIFYCPNGKMAIIEFQKTSKTNVEKHCNNDWFLPRGGRKGDEQRWKVLDIIRLSSQLRLFIIVWSTEEKNLKFKVVDEIVYSDDPAKRKPGIIYKFKKILNEQNLIELLVRWCEK